VIRVLVFLCLITHATALVERRIGYSKNDDAGTMG